MRKDSKVNETFWNDVPQELLTSLQIETRVAGEWVSVAAIETNRTRLIRFQFDQIETTAIRIHVAATYGCPDAKLFEIRCYA